MVTVSNNPDGGLAAYDAGITDTGVGDTSVDLSDAGPTLSDADTNPGATTNDAGSESCAFSTTDSKYADLLCTTLGGRGNSYFTPKVVGESETFLKLEGCEGIGGTDGSDTPILISTAVVVTLGWALEGGGLIAVGGGEALSIGITLGAVAEVAAPVAVAIVGGALVAGGAYLFAKYIAAPLLFDVVIPFLAALQKGLEFDLANSPPRVWCDPSAYVTSNVDAGSVAPGFCGSYAFPRIPPPIDVGPVEAVAVAAAASTIVYLKGRVTPGAPSEVLTKKLIAVINKGRGTGGSLPPNGEGPRGVVSALLAGIAGLTLSPIVEELFGLGGDEVDGDDETESDPNAIQSPFDFELTDDDTILEEGEGQILIGVEGEYPFVPADGIIGVPPDGELDPNVMILPEETMTPATGAKTVLMSAAEEDGDGVGAVNEDGAEVDPDVELADDEDDEDRASDGEAFATGYVDESMSYDDLFAIAQKIGMLSKESIDSELNDTWGIRPDSAAAEVVKDILSTGEETGEGNISDIDGMDTDIETDEDTDIAGIRKELYAELADMEADSELAAVHSHALFLASAMAKRSGAADPGAYEMLLEILRLRDENVDPDQISFLMRLYEAGDKELAEHVDATRQAAATGKGKAAGQALAKAEKSLDELKAELYERGAQLSAAGSDWGSVAFEANYMFGKMLINISDSAAYSALLEILGLKDEGALPQQVHDLLILFQADDPNLSQHIEAVRDEIDDRRRKEITRVVVAGIRKLNVTIKKMAKAKDASKRASELHSLRMLRNMARDASKLAAKSENGEAILSDIAALFRLLRDFRDDQPVAYFLRIMNLISKEVAGSAPYSGIADEIAKTGKHLTGLRSALKRSAYLNAEGGKSDRRVASLKARLRSLHNLLSSVRALEQALELLISHPDQREICRDAIKLIKAELRMLLVKKSLPGTKVDAKYRIIAAESSSDRDEDRLEVVRRVYRLLSAIHDVNAIVRNKSAWKQDGDKVYVKMVRAYEELMHIMELPRTERKTRAAIAEAKREIARLKAERIQITSEALRLAAKIRRLRDNVPQYPLPDTYLGNRVEGTGKYYNGSDGHQQVGTYNYVDGGVRVSPGGRWISRNYPHHAEQ
jgi:hypothetical protein